jgi:spore coat protein CotH
MLYSQYKEYKKLFEIMTADLEKATQESAKSKAVRDKHRPNGKDDGLIDIAKLDNRSINIKRQQAILNNMENLYNREKDRYRKLRRLFDNELMKQTELETEVRFVMQEYLTHVYKKRMRDYEESTYGMGDVSFCLFYFKLVPDKACQGVDGCARERC